MKGFGIEIKNDLLEKKHVEGMGQAIWLYMWLIDKMTSINEKNIGLVLGGKSIKYEEIKKDLGISKNTLTRWTKILLKYPYIITIRTPYGTVYKVLKAKKRFTKKVKRFTNNEESNRFTTNRESNKTIQYNTKNSEYFLPGTGWVKKSETIKK